MSELINNSEKRKDLLKHMILQLHKGIAPDAVRTQLIQLMGQVPYGQVVEVEQELIAEGLPQEEVLKLCDVHSQALKGVIDETGAKMPPPGHPVHTFIQENRAIQMEIAEIEKLITRIDEKSDIRKLWQSLKSHFNNLSDIDKHYRRKENLLFPYLEKHGITGPPTVMWGKDDEIREQLKAAHSALDVNEDISPDEAKTIIGFVIKPTVEVIEEMVYKEEHILFPMCMDKLSNDEWYEIYNQTTEIGYCLYDPQDVWEPAGIDLKKEESAEAGKIQLPSGSFNIQELLAILNILPVDITFVDADDNVRYFNQSAERIFDRTRAIIGRKVQFCHPPSSVHIVEKIIDDFRSGRQEKSAFWINSNGKFIHIEYFALRGQNGEYLGTLEVSQDLTEKRKLEGEQRILSYDGETVEDMSVKEKIKDSSIPAWFDEAKIAKSLDARPILQAGEHPLGQVLTELNTLGQGQIYELIAPFVPAPMIDKVRELGFAAWTKDENSPLVKSYFCKI